MKQMVESTLEKIRPLKHQQWDDFIETIEISMCWILGYWILNNYGICVFYMNTQLAELRMKKIRKEWLQLSDISYVLSRLGVVAEY